MSCVPEGLQEGHLGILYHSLTTNLFTYLSVSVLCCKRDIVTDIDAACLQTLSSVVIVLSNFCIMLRTHCCEELVYEPI